VKRKYLHHRHHTSYICTIDSSYTPDTPVASTIQSAVVVDLCAARACCVVPP
jgi:hypothetical protein